MALSIFAGAALGATAIQALHAQAKPPVYYIAEINVTNPELYGREYAPKAQAMIKAAGGRFLAAGQNITSFEAEPPKQRVVIQVWDNMEKIQVWLNIREWKELLKVSQKYATFREFAAEGLPQ